MRRKPHSTPSVFKASHYAEHDLDGELDAFRREALNRDPSSLPDDLQKRIAKNHRIAARESLLTGNHWKPALIGLTTGIPIGMVALLSVSLWNPQWVGDPLPLHHRGSSLDSSHSFMDDLKLLDFQLVSRINKLLSVDRQDDSWNKAMTELHQSCAAYLEAFRAKGGSASSSPLELERRRAELVSSLDKLESLQLK